MKVQIPRKPSQSIQSTPSPLAVSTREAAAMLGVSERTLREASKRGEIQRCRIGSRVVFPIAAINSLLQGAGGADSVAK